MKKSGIKKVITVLLLTCLVFTAAGCAKDAKQTETTKPADSNQQTTDTSKNNQVTKDDEASSNDNGDSDSDKANQQDQQNQQDSSSQDTSGNNQSADSDDAGTYDASAPADDTAIHRYELIISDATWQEAYKDCISRGGYLARINSSQEYAAIRKEITKQKYTNIYFRIGGRRDSQSQDYYWVNTDNKLFGEKLNSDSSWCSDEWMNGEPSFQDGSLEEKYLDLFFYDGEKRFVWNDVPDDMLAAEPAYAGSLGYICEYEN